MAKSKTECWDNKSGYTEDMWILQRHIACYAKLMGTFVRLNLMTPREAQILSSNFGQERFDDLRDNNFIYGPSNI